VLLLQAGSRFSLVKLMLAQTRQRPRPLLVCPLPFIVLASVSPQPPHTQQLLRPALVCPQPYIVLSSTCSQPAERTPLLNSKTLYQFLDASAIASVPQAELSSDADPPVSSTALEDANISRKFALLSGQTLTNGVKAASLYDPVLPAMGKAYLLTSHWCCCL